MSDEIISEGEKWEIEGSLAGEFVHVEWDSWNCNDPEKVAKAVWEILKPHLSYGSLDRQTVVKHEHHRQDVAGSWRWDYVDEGECTSDEG